MQSPDSMLTGRPHTFHVCALAGTCAACGDKRSDNWIVREDWMNRLAPEALCPECLAALARRRAMARCATAS